VLLGGWYSCDCSVGDDQPTTVSLHAARFTLVRRPPSCGPGGECVTFPLRLVDLRTGRVFEPRHGFSGMVARPDGAFAYLDGRVVAVDAEGERVLDEGPGIEGGSLALAGSIVYWTRQGEPRSARLR
jgi:hypothetical protein